MNGGSPDPRVGDASCSQIHSLNPLSVRSVEHSPRSVVADSSTCTEDSSAPTNDSKRNRPHNPLRTFASMYGLCRIHWQRWQRWSHEERCSAALTGVTPYWPWPNVFPSWCPCGDALDAKLLGLPWPADNPDDRAGVQAARLLCGVPSTADIKLNLQTRATLRLVPSADGDAYVAYGMFADMVLHDFINELIRVARLLLTAAASPSQRLSLTPLVTSSSASAVLRGA